MPYPTKHTILTAFFGMVLFLTLSLACPQGIPPFVTGKAFAEYIEVFGGNGGNDGSTGLFQ
jgi:hypothetical protein